MGLPDSAMNKPLYNQEKVRKFRLESILSKLAADQCNDKCYLTKGYIKIIKNMCKIRQKNRFLGNVQK